MAEVGPLLHYAAVTVQIDCKTKKKHLVQDHVAVGHKLKRKVN